MMDRPTVHLLRPLGATNKQGGITLPGEPKSPVELHRAIAGKYHHIVCRYLGHSAGNLCIGGKRLIADHAQAASRRLEFFTVTVILATSTVAPHWR